MEDYQTSKKQAVITLFDKKGQELIRTFTVMSSESNDSHP